MFRGHVWRALTLALLLLSSGPAAPALATPAVSQAQSTIGPILFASQVNEGHEPVDPATTFPAGLQTLYGTFTHQNMANGIPWSSTWLLDSSVYSVGSYTWSYGPNGTAWVRLQGNGGAALASGTYTLILSFQGQEVTRASTVVGGSSQGKIGPISFAAETGGESRPINPSAQLPSGLSVIYGCFEYQGMQNGVTVAWEWRYNEGRDSAVGSGLWSFGASGKRCIMLGPATAPLPDGEYELTITVAGDVAQRGSVTLGGQSTERPRGSGDMVTVSGVVVDAETGEPIEDAPVWVFRLGLEPYTGGDMPQITEEDFDTWFMASATTDAQGRYTLDNQLKAGITYTFWSTADYYHSTATQEEGLPAYWPWTPGVKISIPDTASGVFTAPPIELRPRG